MAQTAAAALLAPLDSPPAAPGPGAEEAAQRASHLQGVQACLEAEAARAAAELLAAAARTAAAREALQQDCSVAEQQHQEIATALVGLAARLGCLAPGSAGAPLPLLSLDLPDSYARACTQLLDLLAGYVQHHNDSETGSASTATPAAAEQQQHRRRVLELEQLQSGACKAERLRVEEEAEEARLRAELEALRAHSSGPMAAASRGYSAADLEAEVASLQRRRDARLPKVVAAAEAAVAAAVGAGVVEGQAAQRQAALERRLQAKQQAAALLARHLSRQLLIRQLLQHEQAVVQQAQLVAAAARADAEAALQAALDRLPLYAQQQGISGDAAPSSSDAAAPRQAAEAAEAAAVAGEDPVATAAALLQCRRQLAQLLSKLQCDTLPAHQALFAKLHGLLYGSSSGSSSSDDGSTSRSVAASQAAGAAVQRPELTPAALREQLVAVAKAHDKLSLAANALIGEVIDRQQAPGAEQSRVLAQQVLTDFWNKPQRLVALAAEQRRKLESYV